MEDIKVVLSWLWCTKTRKVVRKGKSYNVGWVYKCTVVSKVFLLKKIGKKIE